MGVRAVRVVSISLTLETICHLSPAVRVLRILHLVLIPAAARALPNQAPRLVPSQVLHPVHNPVARFLLSQALRNPRLVLNLVHPGVLSPAAHR